MSALSGILRMGRARAQSIMTETVIIGRYKPGTDPTTGNATRVLVEKRYEGIARVKYPTLNVSTPASAGQAVSVQDITVAIPSTSPLCFEGDEVDVIASTADPALIGRRYTVKGAAQTGQTTAARYPVTQLS